MAHTNPILRHYPALPRPAAVQGFTLDPVTHAIVITFRDKVSQGGQLLTRRASTNTFVWTCPAGSGLNPKYVPSNCRH